jgi:hypothetical protein
MFKHTIVVLVILVFLLASCAPSAPTEALPTITQPPATALPSTNTPIPPTETPLPPTETPLPPTETPLPTSTSLPENVLFRDDFNGPLLEGWSWTEENPQRWSFKDGWLIIFAEDASLLSNLEQSNMLWRDLPDEDFAIVVRVDAPTTSDFQQASIFIYEDENNYVTINRGYCSPCEAGGSGIFMDYKIGRAWGNYNFPITESTVYLMLESKDQKIAGYYAVEPEAWQRVGQVGDYFRFSRVGLGTSNSDPNGIDGDLTASFDFFEIRKP